MYLQWKKSGRSECGQYQATKAAAHYIGTPYTEKLSGPAETAAENRAICQRHKWKLVAHQAINLVFRALMTPDETGAAVLSHALKVDSSQVSRWKLGRALVPARHCESVAKLAGVDVASLRPDLEFFTNAITDGTLFWRKRSLVAGGAES
jgi:hypothetical protein